MWGGIKSIKTLKTENCLVKMGIITVEKTEINSINLQVYSRPFG